MYNLKILNSAYDDLNAIYNFCYNINSVYATKIIQLIEQAIDSLKYFPLINPYYAIFNNRVFRKHILNKRYLIIFIVINFNIIIIRIIDGRKNISPNDLFKTN